jgi:hypothetical protein
MLIKLDYLFFLPEYYTTFLKNGFRDLIVLTVGSLNSRNKTLSQFFWFL